MSSAFRGKDSGAMNYYTKEETSHYCRTVTKQNQRQAFSEHSTEAIQSLAISLILNTLSVDLCDHSFKLLHILISKT